MSRIEREVTEQKKALLVLEEVSEALNARLDSVMRPGPPGGGQEKTAGLGGGAPVPQAPSSSLTDTLIGHTAHLRRVTSLLQEMLERLEI